MVDSKAEDDHKNTLVFNVLVRKIKNHLMESGKCTDEKACEAAAKKMAAFVSDVMKETYKTQRGARRLSLIKVDSKEKRTPSQQRFSLSKIRTRESLPKILEEPSYVKRNSKGHGTTSDHKNEHRSTSMKKQNASNRGAFTPFSFPVESNKMSSKALGDITGVKSEKQQINSWLNDVNERTKKWTKWIQDTVEKAENTKSRVQSGENLRDVSKDWKRFLNSKKEESKNLKESFSDIWKQNEGINEAFRRRGQESIQNWLLKTKKNVHSKDFSNLSVRTASSNESLYSVWSSRGPSSIFGGESDYSRLRQYGMLP